MLRLLCHLSVREGFCFREMHRRFQTLQAIGLVCLHHLNRGLSSHIHVLVPSTNTPLQHQFITLLPLRDRSGTTSSQQLHRSICLLLRHRQRHLHHHPQQPSLRWHHSNPQPGLRMLPTTQTPIWVLFSPAMGRMLLALHPPEAHSPREARAPALTPLPP